MKKKYLVVTLVTILILTIGVSFAYIRGIIVAKNKSNISLKVKELYILFKDETEISEKNIDFGWEETKSFSVENQGDTTFYYNIIIEDLINTLESDGLQYKINSSNGYDMKEFKSIPKSSVEKDTILVENIPINGEETQEYTITLRYFEDPLLDQSGDMGKTFSGKLGITEGEEEGEKVKLAEKIINDNVLKGTRTDFSNALPFVEYDDETGEYGEYDESQDTESGLYKEEDTRFTEDTNNDGIGEEVYYFAGNVKNNWVKFANYYWRIIRTNEDGGIRLLFAGETPDTESGYISEKAFNEYEEEDPMYVGLKYGESGSLESNRLNTHNSTILGSDEGTDEGSLNWWYKNKIQDLGFDDYVSKTAIYCNDRAVAPGDSYSTLPYEPFNFASYYRLSDYENLHDVHPSFKCGVDKNGNVIEGTQNVADKFSTNKSSGGNGELKFPVGLITSDEVVYAGDSGSSPLYASGYYNKNSLDNYVAGLNLSYWFMTPSYWGEADGIGEMVIYVDNMSWYFEDFFDMGMFWAIPDRPYYEKTIRPVISLKSCVTTNRGNGTSDSPYEVSVDESCKLAVN